MEQCPRHRLRRRQQRAPREKSSGPSAVHCGLLRSQLQIPKRESSQETMWNYHTPNLWPHSLLPRTPTDPQRNNWIAVECRSPWKVLSAVQSTAQRSSGPWRGSQGATWPYPGEQIISSLGAIHGTVSVCQCCITVPSFSFLFLAGCWNPAWYKRPSRMWSQTALARAQHGSASSCDQSGLHIFFFLTIHFQTIRLLFEFSPCFLNSLYYEFRNICTTAVNFFCRPWSFCDKHECITPVVKHGLQGFYLL